MKDIIPAKKQSPILGLTGMGGGVGSNLGGSLAKKTYAEDVYSTYLKSFNGSTNIVNNIDLAEEGGMVWTKIRDNSDGFYLADTVNGVNKTLRTNVNNALENNSYAISAFNNNGFTYNDGYGGAKDYVTWTFRKAKGFFDVVTWTGNGSTRTIDHNLGCLPGCIMVKNLTNARDWTVWHRGAVQSNAINTLILNTESQAAGNSSYFDNGSTPPTATNFTVHTSNRVNLSGDNYIAYVFAGGESTAAGSNSIYYPSPSGTVRRILCGDASNTTADFNFGTGDLTIECWIKCSSSQGGYPRVVAIGPQWEAEMAALQWDHSENANRVSFYCYNHSSSTTAPLLRSSVKNFNGDGQYHHCAVTRSGNTWRLFVDGVMEDLQTWTGSTNTANSYCTIGNTPGSATTSWFGGYISNVRIVKGTAVYTSSFRVPTEPLKNITNTKLLCCNNLSGTAATVTPIALTETNIMQNQTDNPFDDPDNFIFGEDGDQNMVKCGSYIGNDSSDGPIINLGWEPQWILIKRSTGGSGDWVLFDNMRGLSTNGLTDSFLPTNENNPEVTNLNCVDISATGFELKSSDTRWNGLSSTYVYMAIRRSDGYVGKPVEAGTDVFTTVYGNSGGTNPSFVTNFVVDSALNRTITGSESWYVTSRLTRDKYMVTNGTAAETTASTFKFDHSNGWRTGGAVPAYLSWNWKRHAGMDVVGYTGAGSFSSVPHSLSKTPEMIWVKKRNATENWIVYHKDLNGGTTPENYYLEVNTQDAEATQQVWNETAPTSTYFTVGGGSWVNGGGDNFIAWLFASVTGVSKVGSFAGSSSDVTLNLGFVPRFLMVKGRTGPSGTNWTVWDNVRGITGGGADTPRMYLNAQSASSAGANDNVFTVDSGGVKGITIVTGPTWNNHQDYNYIYYAHA